MGNSVISTVYLVVCKILSLWDCFCVHSIMSTAFDILVLLFWLWLSCLTLVLKRLNKMRLFWVFCLNTNKLLVYLMCGLKTFCWFNMHVWVCVCASGMMHGATVSTSAFLACHQCYCASLTWDLNLQALVCSIFWSLFPGVFSRYSSFLPSSIGLMVQSIKWSSNRCDLNSVKLNSWAVSSYHLVRITTCCIW